MAATTSHIEAVFAQGNVAVVTGSANGIGRAAALRCAEKGMKVCLVDIDANNLQVAKDLIINQVESANEETVMVQVTDVGNYEAVCALREAVYERFGKVDLLMNNAGTNDGGGPYENMKGWLRVLNVNLYGVIHGVQAFTEKMIAQNSPAYIINTGSKQGITCPPGNTAYNVSKAGVKCLTEGLSYKLRTTDGCQVKVALLVPGWVNTSIALKVKKEKDPNFNEKEIWNENNPAPGAWMPSQVIDYLLENLEAGNFYVICPDNDVSTELDQARNEWTAQDLLQNRQPLSRWDPAYKEEWEEFLKSKGL